MFRSGTQGSARSCEALYPIVGGSRLGAIDAVSGSVDTIGAYGDLCGCHCSAFTVCEAVGGAVR